MKKSISIFLFLTGFFVMVSCSKDEVSEQDPIIGLWKLQHITAGEENVDVTNLACYGQSTLNVTESGMTLLLKSPENGSASCTTDTSSFGWKKNGSVYQVIDNEVGEYVTITLNGGDLLLKFTAGGNSSTFLFRK